MNNGFVVLRKRVRAFSATLETRELSAAGLPCAKCVDADQSGALEICV